MSEIKATAMQNSESMSLETVISNFAPCSIKVTWYEEWEKISEDNPRNIQIGENKLGYFVSKLQFTPKGKDSKKTIRCEVFHQATQDFKETSFVWERKGKNFFFFLCFQRRMYRIYVRDSDISLQKTLLMGEKVIPLLN